jgi:co-chaperonin GroES (HSP10)
MTPQPTGTNLLLKTFDVDMTTSSGLIVSTIQPEKGKGPIEEYAEVIAVGPNVKVAKKGDTVYFKEYNLDRVQTGRVFSPDIHVFIDEKYIIAVEKKAK